MSSEIMQALVFSILCGFVLLVGVVVNRHRS